MWEWLGFREEDEKTDSDITDTPECWANKLAEIKPDSLLWKQYIVYVDLFKFYVDITWKATTWFYAITGAILVYYFAHADDNNPFLRWSLVLPIILSFGLFRIYRRGINQTKDLNEKLTYIRQKLNLPGKPHISVLENFLRVGCILFLLVGYGLVILFVVSFLRG